MNPPPGYQDEGRSIYHLHPLEDPTIEIRLLKLRRRARLVGQLQYSLEVYYLDSAPTYRAISYTWGDSSPTSSVWIAKSEVQVRQNCHHALSQVRQHWPNDFIWIDSICIDQENIAEKNAQVQMMGRIYSNAASVSACLGPHGYDSHHLVKNLKSARDLDGRSGVALQHWIGRPYWYRLWIVQELCLAREIHVHCGSTALPWPDVYKAIMDSGRETPYVRFLGDLVNEAMVTGKPPTLQLQEHTQILQDAKCADPRDKIFGLLNIAEADDSEGFDAIRVDYSKSAWALALEIAQRPSALYSFSDQVAQLLPLLEVTARNSNFRTQVELRAKLRRGIKPHKKAIQGIEELCAHLLRCGPDYRNHDVRREHPGWVSCKRSCKAVALCSNGLGCAHELYIPTVEKVTARESRSFIRALAANPNPKPEPKPCWYDLIPTPRKGYKMIYGHQKPVAVVGQEATVGDILVFSDMAPSTEKARSLGKHLLVARQFDGDVYHIVGQGFFLPEFPESKCLSREAIWLLGAEDAMTTMAHLRLHKCTQRCLDTGRCTHWLDILNTAVPASPLSSFVFCRDTDDPTRYAKMEGDEPCSICGADPHQTQRNTRISKTVMRSFMGPFAIVMLVAVAVHPAMAVLGVILYAMYYVIEEGHSIKADISAGRRIRPAR